MNIKQPFALKRTASALLALSGALMLYSARAATTNVVASSVDEFSTTQGQNNWFYGYCVGGYSSSGFIEFPVFAGWGAWVTGGNVWTAIWQAGGHPNGLNGNQGRDRVLHVAVRRWVSTVEGQVTISGDVGGAFTTVQVVVDGTTVFSRTGGAVSPYTASARVKRGSVVDFTIDPAGSDVNDSTTFTGRVLHSPKQVYVLLVGVDWTSDGDPNEVNGQNDTALLGPSFRTAVPDGTVESLPLSISASGNREAFQAKLNGIRDKLGPNDTFVLYASSHGGYADLFASAPEPGDEVPVNAETFNGRRLSATDEFIALSRTEGLTDDEFAGLFRTDPKWREIDKLFLLDTCHAGGFWGSTTFGDSGDLSTVPHSALVAAAPEADTATYDSAVMKSDFAVSLSATLEVLGSKDSFDTVGFYGLLNQEGVRLFQSRDFGIRKSVWTNAPTVIPARWNATLSTTSDFDGHMKGLRPSTLVIQVIPHPSASSFVFRFPTLYGKRYSIESTDTLATNAWSVVQTNMFGTGVPLSVTNAVNPIQHHRFFRVAEFP